MEGGHLMGYSGSCNSSPFPVSKQIQSIDPMIVSVHRVFENSTPSSGYCWNVRMVCIQSETDHSAASQKECNASLEIMQDFAHGYLDPVIYCVITPSTVMRLRWWKVIAPEGPLCMLLSISECVLNVCYDIFSFLFYFACSSIRDDPMVLLKKYTGNEFYKMVVTPLGPLVS